MAATPFSLVVVWTGAEGAVVDMSFVFSTRVVFAVFCITGVDFSVPGWPLAIVLPVGAGTVGTVCCIVSWFVGWAPSVD